MEDDLALSELLLRQSPACQWMVSADGVFQRVFGNTSPVFGKLAADLAGRAISRVVSRSASDAWMARFARVFAGETLTLRERHGVDIWNITVFPVRVNAVIGYAGGWAREATAWITAEEELRRTVLSALKAQASERSAVSKFLHNSIGQNLTALGLQLDLVRMDLEAVSPETCTRITEIQQLLGGMMEEVREYSYELNPSAVERAGLRAALDRLTERLRARFAGTLRVNMDPGLKLDPQMSRAMFEIAQEAVKNSVQHSSCSAIEIAVKSTRSGIALEIRDNGRGFDPADPMGGSRGLGLLSMEHYAAQAGLELGIASNPKTGTIVRAASAVRAPA
ncbi:MAG TPA: ATP-binding protein [Candidatus Acidoferrales bacterium]|jgi:signal transduction histidine kinase|nr:ATP-binding protein [Candidatus Acidoferrales bacterium]